MQCWLQRLFTGSRAQRAQYGAPQVRGTARAPSRSDAEAGQGGPCSVQAGQHSAQHTSPSCCMSRWGGGWGAPEGRAGRAAGASPADSLPCRNEDAITLEFLCLLTPQLSVPRMWSSLLRHFRQADAWTGCGEMG